MIKNKVYRNQVKNILDYKPTFVLLNNNLKNYFSEMCWVQPMSQ